MIPFHTHVLLVLIDNNLVPVPMDDEVEEEQYTDQFEVVCLQAANPFRNIHGQIVHRPGVPGQLFMAREDEDPRFINIWRPEHQGRWSRVERHRFRKLYPHDR